MRAAYIPSERFWAQYYINQSKQSGAGFIGVPYQRGAGLGSLFRGIFRALLPVVKSAGKTIGKQALATGAEIASDVVAGKTLSSSAKSRAKAGASTLLRKAADNLVQEGEGLGRRKKRVVKRKRIRRKKATKARKTRAKKPRKSGYRNLKRKSDQLGNYFM